MGRTELQRAEQPIGRRGRNRLRARLAAKIVLRDDTCKTILLDLSQTGARLRAGPGMAPGLQGVLIWAGFEAFGRLVWVERGMCGMAFEQPLPQQVLIATRDLDARD